MVNIKFGLLLKIQAQSKKFSYLINHAKIVGTKTKHTIKNSGIDVRQEIQTIQVMTMDVLNTNQIAIMMDVLNTILMVIWLGSGD